MKIILTTFIISFSSIFTFGNNIWANDFSKVDSISRLVRPIGNIEKLSKKLTSPFKENVQKYRAIYTWISTHIKYDCVGLKDLEKRENDPVKVIKRKKAVCEGYSTLFKQLCAHSNLKCEIIRGWTHNNENLIGTPLEDKITHSWNAISLNGQWQLIDVTWGAGFTQNNNTSFVFSFNDYYFCTPPTLFSYEHYPESPKWLLGSEILKDEFRNQPRYYGNAIKQELTNLNLTNGILNFNTSDSLSFSFNTTEHVTRISIGERGNNKSETVPFQVNNDKVSFSYTPKKYSEFLIIYLNNQGILIYKLNK